MPILPKKNLTKSQEVYLLLLVSKGLGNITLSKLDNLTFLFRSMLKFKRLLRRYFNE